MSAATPHPQKTEPKAGESVSSPGDSQTPAPNPCWRECRTWHTLKPPSLCKSILPSTLPTPNSELTPQSQPPQRESGVKEANEQQIPKYSNYKRLKVAQTVKTKARASKQPQRTISGKFLRVFVTARAMKAMDLRNWDVLETGSARGAVSHPLRAGTGSKQSPGAPHKH